MKKAFYAFVMISLFSLSFMPALAADVTVGVSTGLTQDTSGGANPLVKAKWEAIGTSTAMVSYFQDDSTDAGAQFLPSGQYRVNKKIALCSIVTDPDGLADITTAPGAVYADVFYPDGVSLGSSHVSLTDQSGLGCGQMMQEDKLTKLSKLDGIQLFCNNVRNLNNNLPTFATGRDAASWYTEICKADGELQKETAGVFCATKDISYEDPAGSYKVWAVGQDKVGLQNTLENHFTYLPTTAFETDFSSIAYGNVRLATDKIINGDIAWATNDLSTGWVAGPLATIRNTGNTRIQVSIQQNDMGFGKTNGLWNVQYDARIGNNETDWAHYDPDTLTALLKTLDLSEHNEMDFSILVSKFPPTHTGPYTGTMSLSAQAVDQLSICPVRTDRTQAGFGDGGWAGWSCPAGTHVVGGGIDSSTNPVGGNGMAAPGAPAIDGFSYPVYPHYTFPAGETGYVVHDLPDGLGNTISFHLDCLAN